MKRSAVLLVVSIACTSMTIKAMKTSVLFPGADGIMIRADYYTISPYQEMQ